MIADLVTFLSANAAIAALAGSRVYPVNLPQKPTLPAISFHDISSVWVRDLSGPPTKVRRRIQIDAWANTHLEAQQLGDAIRRALNGFDGSMSGTHMGSVWADNRFADSAPEGGVAGIYRVSQDFIFAATEN
jgi:hypothetical protein